MGQPIMRTQTLFLDDARIGRFRPQANSLHQGFLEMVCQSPCSHNLKEFLIHGANAVSHLSDKLQSRLGAWKGIPEFKRSLVRDLESASEQHGFLASRARCLMQFGARMLFQNCRRCLTVDLSWPAYQYELTRAATQLGGDIINAPLRKSLLEKGWDIEEICDYLASVCRQQRCDGIFLPAVDSWGIQLPIQAIVERLRQEQEIRFVLIDAAQAIGHVDLAPLSGIADFLVAGTHKWVGSYFPLGIGIACNPNSQTWISNCVQSMIASTSMDDGLLKFVSSVETNREVRHPETANLGPLIAACGAWKGTPCVRKSLPTRLQNADQVAEIASTIGWTPIRPNLEMRTGCLLLQAADKEIRNSNPDELRLAFSDSGLILSTYHEGIIRLAMPASKLQTHEMLQIESALERVSQRALVTC